MEQRPAPLLRVQQPLPRAILGFVLFVIALHFAYSYALAFRSTSASPFWFPGSVLLCALLWAPARWTSAG